MKKSLFTTGCALLTVAVSAQFVMKYETHAIRTGDNHHFIITNNTGVGTPGASQVWDFTDLTSAGDLTSHMINSMETPRFDEIPQANAVIEEFGNKFYFKVTKDRIDNYGVIGCGNGLIRFDNPWAKMIFPFSYGDVHEGTFSGYSGTEANANPIGGTYSLEADGCGTLLLPGGVEINNVLRHKTTLNYSQGTCQTSTITYRWYCKEVRYPLLSIIQEVTPGKTYISRTAYYADAGNIVQKPGNDDDDKNTKKLAGEGIKLSIYPNPYSEAFDVNYSLSESSKVTLSIYDNTGKQIKSHNLGTIEAGAHKFQVKASENGMRPGAYIVKIFVNDDVITTKVVQID